ncbi:NUDIX domain-containing protein [Streptomyces diacarni]|uniref:NUDIX domain-containing protein n=1 Tax=Streptomyces diacarni TaxID=2800381 RepID=A0A367FB18_9ACTN|nr:NUDIX domain-containing protein [Streptomyces diacarni]RCG27563.1 NUDIX domain-containing protein [Streptomyces diacarni]
MTPEPATPATPVIDTHVFVRDGNKLLLSLRGSPYGYGRWHAPSGKLDRGEFLAAGAARELYEETGLSVDPEDLRMVHVVHHKEGQDNDRIGFFFEATRFRGEPVNREPDKCLGLRWFAVDDLPDDLIAYPAAGLLGYLSGTSPLSEHGW